MYSNENQGYYFYMTYLMGKIICVYFRIFFESHLSEYICFRSVILLPKFELIKIMFYISNFQLNSFTIKLNLNNFRSTQVRRTYNILRPKLKLCTCLECIVSTYSEIKIYHPKIVGFRIEKLSTHTIKVNGYNSPKIMFRFRIIKSHKSCIKTNIGRKRHISFPM